MPFEMTGELSTAVCKESLFAEELQIRIQGNPENPVLIYLPGVHGDWTLIGTFRKLISKKFHFIEMTFPRTLTWSLEDYARGVDEALIGAGISHGWILAESFSSQVLWALLKRNSSFHCEGIILAGGFVKYPMYFVLRLVEMLFGLLPWKMWKFLLWIYVKYSGFRHRKAPESAEGVQEFISRRTERDLEAIRHRLKLIAQADLRSTAKDPGCPVFLLAGVLDPVVPTWPVLRWLRKHCTSFTGHRIVWPADHNVLGTEPYQAAEQIELWARQGDYCPSSPLPLG
jgi:pimeloyl-ACP methyl ester carboxylesterase